MKFALPLLATLALSPPAPSRQAPAPPAPQPAQSAPPASLAFHFVRPGLPVPEFTLTVHEDGSGTYAATYAAPPAPPSRFASSADVIQPAASAEISRPITLSAQTTARIFERARSTNGFQGGCASREKNIADTGAKTLTYTGPGGPAQCTYNFTEVKPVVALTDTFLAIAQTLDQGRIIDFKHRYDRLGLDQELNTLSEALHEGRALEISTIAPILQSLLDDPQVMERVRKRAATLLTPPNPTH